MRIISYKSGSKGGDAIQFPEIKFGKINLVVGNSGAGKTRLLNTIFNGALNVTHKDKFFAGFWDVVLEHGEVKYRWTLETGQEQEGDEVRVVKESISQFGDDKQERLLVERTPDYFKFDGKDLPKLSPQDSSISILQDEELIKPIYEALTYIMRRNFSGADLDKAASYQVMPEKFLEKIQRTKKLLDLFHSGLFLNCRLYILSKTFEEIYNKVCEEFKNVFPFVSQVRMFNSEKFGLDYPGIVPVFALKEKHSDKWVPLERFSSGMKKVLLILADIFILPEKGCVYLVDEYENSLGVNAINFFPSVLFEAPSKSQFIITSHHPYIIGKIPVKDWVVLHRKGDNVQVKQGEELVDKFGKSKQQAFVQLMNDPFYIEGVE